MGEDEGDRNDGKHTHILINIRQQISMIEDQTIADAKLDLIDLDPHIKNITKWEKIPYISSNIKSMFENLM